MPKAIGDRISVGIPQHEAQFAGLCRGIPLLDKGVLRPECIGHQTVIICHSLPPAVRILQAIRQVLQQDQIIRLLIKQHLQMEQPAGLRIEQNDRVNKRRMVQRRTDRRKHRARGRVKDSAAFRKYLT